MSMFRINTNMSALFAQRQLRGSNQTLAEAQERLSSGLRINSAADDAAGLSISQKMTAQIRGLDMASRNAQDGISMIQTAEGALEESQNSLQRMRELAVQAANDTLTKDDREKLQSEMNNLAIEIQRISEDTEFNEKKLLDGTLADAQFQVGANEGQTISLSVSDMGTEESALDVAGDGETDQTISMDAVLSDGAGGNDIGTNAANSGTYTIGENSDGNLTIENSSGETVAVTSTATGRNQGVKFVGIGANSGANFGDDSVTFTAALDKGDTFVLSGGTINSSSIAGDGTKTVEGTNNGLEAGKYTISSTSTSSVGVFTLKDDDGNVVAKTLSGAGEEFFGLNSVGTVDSSNSLLDFSSNLGENIDSSLNGGNGFQFDGDETVTVGGPDISTDASNAESAITTIDNAIQEISQERSELGALQNRLETTISADNITRENLQAARSRIRDADVAQEAVKQTRSNILVQAGTSVLAQANTNPQLALQLLG